MQIQSGTPDSNGLYVVYYRKYPCDNYATAEIMSWWGGGFLRMGNSVKADVEVEGWAGPLPSIRLGEFVPKKQHIAAPAARKLR